MEFEILISIIFIVLGVLMLLAELMNPGVFLIVPGTVLIVLGFLGMAFPEFLLSIYSPLLAVGILIPMTYVTIKMYQKLAPPAPPETIVATSLIGREGIVTTEIQPNSLIGKVRIEHDNWSATSDKIIPKGRKVVVKASEGVHVTVEELL